MVALPSFLSPSSDDRGRARVRLVAMRGGKRPTTASADELPAAPADAASPNESLPNESLPDALTPDESLLERSPADGAGEDVVPGGDPARPREGRLVRWWVPGALQQARWDPGRPGALMLTLVAALAAVIAAIGVWWDRPVPVPAPALPLVAPVDAAPSLGASPGGGSELVISVVGRVARPGLVRLPDGARVADALDAVGGALPDTDLVSLNLARRLSDGEQLLVGVPPPPGQPVDGGVLGTPADTAAGTGAVTGAIDLNTATLEQLDTLPGIGPVTAQRIVDWRAAHGRFRSVDQLREISGIGEARFAQLKDLVRV